jgi:hypothetical protein
VKEGYSQPPVNVNESKALARAAKFLDDGFDLVVAAPGNYNRRLN